MIQGLLLYKFFYYLESHLGGKGLTLTLTSRHITVLKLKSFMPLGKLKSFTSTVTVFPKKEDGIK